MEAGAVMAYVYEDESGRRIDEFLVEQNDCTVQAIDRFTNQQKENVADLANSSGAETYLVCSLVGPRAADHQYSFALDGGRGILFWVDGNVEFEVSRNTSTQIWASREWNFRDLDYDSTLFRLNRVTGKAALSYTRKPSTAEVESCTKERSWGCQDSFVLTEYEETGSCSVVERIIK